MEKKEYSSLLDRVRNIGSKKLVQGALFLTLTAGGVKTCDIMRDKDGIENVLEMKNYPFPKNHLKGWDDNKEYFKQNLQLKKEELAPGVNIIKDAGLVFYVVQEEDIVHEKYQEKNKKGKLIEKTRKVVDFEKIRHKLMRFKEFDYLKRDEYIRKENVNKTISFNIPRPEGAKKGFYLPVPIDSKIREISDQDFANYCHEAIIEMVQDTNTYGKIMEKVVDEIGETKFINAMLAFARSETSPDFKEFSKNIGSVELHRRENNYKAFSFTYFHILMEKNADGKTPGPGLKARLKLGLTEGQTYHPKNAAKLFLGYWIEKCGRNPEKIINNLDIMEDNIKQVAKTYNGDSGYSKKLEANYNFIKDNVLTKK